MPKTMPHPFTRRDSKDKVKALQALCSDNQQKLDESLALAERRYEQYRAQIAALTERMNVALASRDGQRHNWGDTGDLGFVAERLEEVVNFLEGNDC